MKRKLVVFSLVSLVSQMTFAGVKVSTVSYESRGNESFVKIAVEGKSNELPEMNIKDQLLEITLGDAEDFKAINKTSDGINLTARSVKGKAIVWAKLPFKVKENEVNLGWKNNQIEVTFPTGKIVEVKKEATPVKVAAAAIVKPAKESPLKNELNEDYLNKLSKKMEAPEEKKVAKVDDAVSVTQSSIAKNAEVKAPVNNGFSFAGYAAKFTVFLALVIGAFYAVVSIFKKGVFNRGKLGFLNNSQLIEVISTTYISPKRSLSVIRAHKQVFLVSNSEAGVSLISEITDTAGLIKVGEKELTGTNFDMKLEDVREEETEIKVKEDIFASTPVEDNSAFEKFVTKKDIVKFSDELKKKAKKLKPIEFN